MLRSSLWLVIVVLLLAACATGGSEGATPDVSDGATTPDVAAQPSPPSDADGVDPDDAPDPQPTPADPAGGDPEPDVDPAEVGANELGQIPVLMYHRILDDGGGDYDRTPGEFRAELKRLFDDGYVPVRLDEVADGRIDIPAGRSPVVLTFDDATREQMGYADDGEIDPDTAIGILEDVAAGYDHIEPTATLYVLPDPFGGVAEGDELLRELHERGYELGNHTCSHTPFSGRAREEVQEDLACGARVVTDAIDDAEVRTMALPLGVWPDEREWAYEGETETGSFHHQAIALVGSNPTPSPFHADFDAMAVPRIRTGDWDGGEPDYASGFWLDWLEDNPERRYVSDGSPDTISFPADRADELADEFADRANPYDP